MQRLTTILDVVGCTAIAVGIGLIWFPAGVIAAGAGLVIISWRLSK